MSYVASNNLIHARPFDTLVKKGFRLKPSKDAGLKRSIYVCPYCKKIYKTNPFVFVGSYQMMCKKCKTILELEVVNGGFSFGFKENPFVYQFRSIKSILIGIQRDDADGHVVAVNGTFFEQKRYVSRHWSKKDQNWVQKYNSYVVMRRIIFHIDQKQVYFVTKPSTKDDPNKGFEHFLLKSYSWVTSPHAMSNEHQILYRNMIETVFLQAYGYTLPQALLPFASLSVAQCYYLLKFPIWMKYYWRTPTYITDTKAFLLEFVHWLCNADRKLRPMLVCIDEAIFCERWQEYLKKKFGCDDTIENLLTVQGHTPFLLLFAWQMGHVGFNDIQSCKQMEKALLSISSKTDRHLSMPLFFLLDKRSHAINKWYRRLLATHGEPAVVQMLLQSSLQGDYGEYVYYYRPLFEEKIAKIDFALEDFSKPLDSFLRKK